MTTIPPEAIEAAAKAMSDDWNPDRDPVLTAMNRDYATSALTAALPHIEAAIREQVSTAIEALGAYARSAAAAAYSNAARIARGVDR